jgi:hypothetical protein
VNTIGHPAPQSKGPDVLFHTEKAVIAWQTKLTKQESAPTWKVIQKEIDKTKPIAQVKPVCLVFVSLNLGQEISAALNNEGIVFLFFASF